MRTRIEMLLQRTTELTVKVERRALHQHTNVELGEIHALYVYSYGTILPSCNSEKEPVKTVLHRRCGAATRYAGTVGSIFPPFPPLSPFPPFASATPKVVSQPRLSHTSR